jgi:hypothetical protein
LPNLKTLPAPALLLIRVIPKSAQVAASKNLIELKTKFI